MGRPGGFQEDEAPPPECDRNAFKLYLAGIPRTWELNDLRRIVEKFGQVRLRCSRSLFEINEHTITACVRPEE